MSQIPSNFYVIPSFHDTNDVPVSIEKYKKEWHLLAIARSIFEKNSLEALGQSINPQYWKIFIQNCENDFKKNNLPQELIYCLQLFPGDPNGIENDPIWSMTPNPYLPTISAVVEVSAVRKAYEKCKQDINNLASQARTLEKELLRLQSLNANKEITDEWKQGIKNIRKNPAFHNWDIVLSNMEQNMYDVLVKYNLHIPEELSHLQTYPD